MGDFGKYFLKTENSSSGIASKSVPLVLASSNGLNWGYRASRNLATLYFVMSNPFLTLSLQIPLLLKDQSEKVTRSLWNGLRSFTARKRPCWAHSKRLHRLLAPKMAVLLPCLL
jgi:hypothetical protein